MRGPMTDREQTRRDAENWRSVVSAELTGQWMSAVILALLAELEHVERALDAAMQYVAPRDREWIEGIRHGR